MFPGVPRAVPVRRIPSAYSTLVRSTALDVPVPVAGPGARPVRRARRRAGCRSRRAHTMGRCAGTLA